MTTLLSDKRAKVIAGGETYYVRTRRVFIPAENPFDRPVQQGQYEVDNGKETVVIETDADLRDTCKNIVRWLSPSPMPSPGTWSNAQPGSPPQNPGQAGAP